MARDCNEDGILIEDDEMTPETLTQPPTDDAKKRADALAFCEMVEEIGMPEETVIPVWPADTEMCITHPLTVGMVGVFKTTLTDAVVIDAPEGLDDAIKNFKLEDIILSSPDGKRAYERLEKIKEAARRYKELTDGK